MTLAAIVQLLSGALLLLQLVAANPALPQSFRDTAQQVAQSAITEATRALAIAPTTSVTPKPTPSVVTPTTPTTQCPVYQQPICPSGQYVEQGSIGMNGCRSASRCVQNTVPPTPTTQSCTFNGQTVAHGQSVTAYQSTSVPAGQSCVSAPRTCTNGALSGTYMYAPCMVQPLPVPTPVTLTSYPNFSNLCSAFVTGYGGGQNILGQYAPTCTTAARPTPLLFSVTHENETSGHADSANYSLGRSVFMNDYDYAADFGQWVRADFYPDGANHTLGMALDTVNYQKTNVTGWPLQFGHLFFGLNDLSIANAQPALDKDIVLEFDVRIRGDEVTSHLYPNKFSGHRFMIGARFDWSETSRSNTVHFFEIDLTQTQGYSSRYGDPDYPLCHDATYNRCFYDPNGVYAEGRVVPYSAISSQNPTFATDQWVHIRIPLSAYVKSLGWVSKPASWAQAKFVGTYIGLESTGATRYWIEVKNYQVYYLQ